MNQPSEKSSRAGAVIDDVTFQRLLVRHSDRILNALVPRIPQRLRGSLSAEDLLQDAFVTAIRSRATCKSARDDTFLAWLMVIAERRLVDAVRKQGTAKRGGSDGARAAIVPAMSTIIDLLDIVAIDQHTPSRSAARREAVRSVREALAELSEDYREVIRLRYIKGLSVEKTARRMNRSEGAVMKLCQRGLRALEEAIGDPGRFFSRKG